MKRSNWYSPSFLTFALILPASGDVIYSNLLDTAIPTDFTGVTLNIAGGTINSFFGGVGVANNNLFQPGRTAAGNLGTLQNFAVGSTIDTGLLLGTGYGGSQDHLGTTFTAGQEGYIGFKLNGANYGWMRVVFTGNTSGAVIKDWAYDNSASSIVNGRIEQSAAVSLAQTVTLSPNGSESFSLGSVISNTGGNTNSVVKTGTGTTILKGTNTYTGTTTINAGVLTINGDQSAAAGNVSVSGTGTRLNGTGTIGGDTTINIGAIQSAGGSTANVNKIGKQTFDETGDATADLTYGAGSIFEWDLNTNKDTDGYDHDSDSETANTNVGTRGTDYDAVDVSGVLTVSPTAVFRVVLGSSVGVDSATFWQQNQSWTDIFGGGFTLAGEGFSNSLLEVVDAATGTVYNQNSLNSGFGFTITGTTLTWSAVPEPTSALVGLLITAGLLRRRRVA